MAARPSQEALKRHDEACRARKKHYIDPDTGYEVMTSYYLTMRTTCCGSGCRHCPWPPDVQKRVQRPNVPSYPFPAHES